MMVIQLYPSPRPAATGGPTVAVARERCPVSKSRLVALAQSKVAHFAQERGREEQSEEGHFAHFSKHAF